MTITSIHPGFIQIKIKHFEENDNSKYILVKSEVLNKTFEMYSKLLQGQKLLWHYFLALLCQYVNHNCKIEIKSFKTINCISVSSSHHNLESLQVFVLACLLESV